MYCYEMPWGAPSLIAGLGLQSTKYEKGRRVTGRDAKACSPLSCHP
jgi:hypothetical protein